MTGPRAPSPPRAPPRSPRSPSLQHDVTEAPYVEAIEAAETVEITEHTISVGIDLDDEDGDSRASTPSSALEEALRPWPMPRSRGSPSPSPSTRTASPPARRGGLAHVSSMLTATGFPALDASLAGAPVVPEDGLHAVSARQAEAITRLVTGLLREYTARGELCQQLLAKLARAETERDALAADAADAADADAPPAPVVRELEASLAAMSRRNHQLKDSVSNERIRAAEAVRAHDALQQQLDATLLALEQQRDAFETLQRKTERSRRHNERTLAAVKAHAARRGDQGGLDRMTLELIDVYEAKLETLEGELEAAAERRRAPLNDLDLDDKLAGEMREFAEEQALADQSPRRAAAQLAGARADRLIRVQLEQARRRARELEADRDRAVEDRDLARLQLLAYQKPAWAQRETDRMRLSTRDMIRKDKLSHSLRLYRVDTMDLGECRNVIKEMCIRMRLADVDHLLMGLENMEKVVKLVPQMQRFIATVHATVHQQQRTAALPPPGKFRETLELVAEWGRGMRRLRALEVFEQRVHELMGVRPTATSRQDVYAALRATGVAARGQDDEKARILRIVNYFQELFDVAALDECYNKINQVYLFVSQCEESVNRLASILELGDDVAAEQVLKRACEVLTRLLLEKPLAGGLSAIVLAPPRSSRSPPRPAAVAGLPPASPPAVEAALFSDPEDAVDMADGDLFGEAPPASPLRSIGSRSPQRSTGGSPAKSQSPAKSLSPPKSQSPEATGTEFEELEAALRFSRSLRVPAGSQAAAHSSSPRTSTSPSPTMVEPDAGTASALDRLLSRVQQIRVQSPPRGGSFA